MNKRPDDDLPGAGGDTATRAGDEPSERGADTVSGPALAREIGGRQGPEPTRFGDWEKNGRCIDF